MGEGAQGRWKAIEGHGVFRLDVLRVEAAHWDDVAGRIGVTAALRESDLALGLAVVVDGTVTTAHLSDGNTGR